MTIYVTYTPHKGNVWGKAIMDQNMTLDEVKKAIEDTKKECEDLGITCQFETPDDILREFFEMVEQVRNKKVD